MYKDLDIKTCLKHIDIKAYQLLEHSPVLVYIYTINICRIKLITALSAQGCECVCMQNQSQHISYMYIYIYIYIQNQSDYCIVNPGQTTVILCRIRKNQ